MVLKDAIHNLYINKIPMEHRIARNAMYRHMWSFFSRDKVVAFQSNYREYIKGIKLLTTEVHMNYEGVEKDLEILHSVGLYSIFDFQEEELERDKLFPSNTPPGHGDEVDPVGCTEGTEDRREDTAGPGTNVVPPVQFQLSGSSDCSLIRYIEQLEQTATGLAASLRELKQRVLQNTVKEDNN